MNLIGQRLSLFAPIGPCQLLKIFKMRRLPRKLSSKGFSYSIKRQAESGIYFVQRNSVGSDILNVCKKFKEDKVRLKYQLNVTRHNNNVYRRMVQKLTVDNQTATDRYLESLEYTNDLKTEISSLKQRSNDQSELMIENERLKSSLDSQIGLGFVISTII